MLLISEIFLFFLYLNNLIFKIFAIIKAIFVVKKTYINLNVEKVFGLVFFFKKPLLQGVHYKRLALSLTRLELMSWHYL